MDASSFFATVFGLLFAFAMILVCVIIWIVLPRERGKPRTLLEKERYWYYVRSIEESIELMPNEILFLTFDREGPVCISISRSDIDGVPFAKSFVRFIRKGNKKVYEFRASPDIDGSTNTPLENLP